MHSSTPCALKVINLHTILSTPVGHSLDEAAYIKYSLKQKQQYKVNTMNSNHLYTLITLISIHTHTHTYTHTRTHARTHAHSGTRTHARTHARTHHKYVHYW